MFFVSLSYREITHFENKKRENLSRVTQCIEKPLSHVKNDKKHTIQTQISLIQKKFFSILFIFYRFYIRTKGMVYLSIYWVTLVEELWKREMWIEREGE